MNAQSLIQAAEKGCLCHPRWTMRAALSVTFSMTMLLGGCTTLEPDAAHHGVTLTPPHSHLPPAPAGIKIESGVNVVLDAKLQQAVVTGVAKWMKAPRTVQFGTMEAARNTRGTVTVCGNVQGRNASGAYASMTRYIGVMWAPLPAQSSSLSA